MTTHSLNIKFIPNPNVLVTNLLQEKTPVTFRAGGPSMTPTLRDGDTVQVRPLRPRDPRPGAITLYLAHGRLILHRVIRVDRKDETASIVADAALFGTQCVPLSSLTGIAHCVLKNGMQHRLDRWCDRWIGLTRYYLRPMRRAIHMCRPRRKSETR